MLGIIALLIAGGAAIWLLFRATSNNVVDGEARNVTILKAVVWLAIVAALFAANLTPIALMILVAAGGVTAIEVWRNRAIKELEVGEKPISTSSKMTPKDAASVLGIEIDAAESEIREAHRRLISQLHPDKGGTDFLAAQINEARKILLKAKSDL